MLKLLIKTSSRLYPNLWNFSIQVQKPLRLPPATLKFIKIFIPKLQEEGHKKFFCEMSGSGSGDTLGTTSTSTTKVETQLDELPNVVFVLGRPGSGKGTQCSKIVEAYGFVHLSAGDLLREERLNPTSRVGELIETHIRNGTIVPVEITCSLIEVAMKKSGAKYFLIDGFPRSQNNLEGWEKAMSDKVKLLCVLVIDCTEEECVERCLSRGKAGSGRSDDNPESLKKRIVTYGRDTQPIIDYFMNKNLVQVINGADDPEKVFENVQKVFSDLKVPVVKI